MGSFWFEFVGPIDGVDVDTEGIGPEGRGIAGRLHHNGENTRETCHTRGGAIFKRLLPPAELEGCGRRPYNTVDLDRDTAGSDSAEGIILTGVVVEGLRAWLQKCEGQI